MTDSMPMPLVTLPPYHPTTEGYNYPWGLDYYKSWRQLAINVDPPPPPPPPVIVPPPVVTPPVDPFAEFYKGSSRGIYVGEARGILGQQELNEAAWNTHLHFAELGKYDNSDAEYTRSSKQIMFYNKYEEVLTNLINTSVRGVVAFPIALVQNIWSWVNKQPTPVRPTSTASITNTGP